MSQSKPIQLYLLGIAALVASIKYNEDCPWCAVGLLGVFIILFIVASVLVYQHKKKIKRLKDKGLL